MFLPVRMSQNRMLSSWLAEARVLPSGLKATADDGIGVSAEGVRRFLLLPLAGR